MKNVYFSLLILFIFYGCSMSPAKNEKPVPEPIVELESTRCVCQVRGDNCFNRWGVTREENGDYYVGYFKNGKRSGDGTLVRANGTRTRTYWENNKEVGEGHRQIGDSMKAKYYPIRERDATCEDDESRQILRDVSTMMSGPVFSPPSIPLSQPSIPGGDIFIEEREEGGYSGSPEPTSKPPGGDDPFCSWTGTCSQK